MFKVAKAIGVDGLKEAARIMEQIYQENPAHWPHGLSPSHFEGGVYLIREKRSNVPVGFTAWQERDKWEHAPLAKASCVFQENGQLIPMRRVKIGMYSIGILPEYRNNGYAKEAVSKLIARKSAGVDRVQALVVSSNTPSLQLARSLRIPVKTKF